MRAKRLSTILVGFMLAASAVIVLHLNALSAAPSARTAAARTPAAQSATPLPSATALPLASPSAAACAAPPTRLALAFTGNAGDTTALDLHLP